MHSLVGGPIPPFGVGNAYRPGVLVNAKGLRNLRSLRVAHYIPVRVYASGRLPRYSVSRDTCDRRMALLGWRVTPHKLLGRNAIGVDISREYIEGMVDKKVESVSGMLFAVDSI